MKKSRYNIFFNFQNNKYCFNSKNSSLVEIGHEDLKLLNNQQANECDSKNLLQLKTEGIVIENEEEELAEILHLHRQAKYSNDELGITLINTTKCNLSCAYCYEKRHNATTISFPQLDELVKFIQFQVTNNPIKIIHFSLLGGEALVEPASLNYLFEKLEFLNNKIQIKTTLVTNGVLIENNLKNFSRWHINDIQITFDGDQRNHDHYRHDENGCGTFFKILKNIKILIDAEYTPIVRVNITEQNKNDGTLIINRLHDLNLHPYIYFAQVRDYSNGCNAFNCVSRKEFNELEFELTKLAFQKGFKVSLVPEPKSNYCTADHQMGHVIDSNGDFYKCWHHIGKKEYSYTNLANWNENFVQHNFIRYMNEDFNKDQECLKCVFLPTCFGGCPMERKEYKRKICHQYKSKAIQYLKTYISGVSNE